MGIFYAQSFDFVLKKVLRIDLLKAILYKKPARGWRINNFTITVKSKE